MAKRRDLETDIEGIDIPSSPQIRRGQGLDGIIGQQQPDITPGTETELSDDETDELQRCETIIERGLKTFFEVGAALLRVRDLKLYRVDHPTFEAYCQERWDFTKTYANNLIAATSVRNNLTTIVVKQLPANEAQARPLAKLKDPEQQREVWERVVQRADELGKRITADLVASVVSELQPPELPASPTPEPLSSVPGTGSVGAENAHSEPIPETVSDVPQQSAQQDMGGELIDTDDLDDPRLVEPPGGWSNDMEDLHRQLETQGYELQAESDSRLTYRHRVMDSVVCVIKPPELDTVRLRVIAHQDTDWSDVAGRLAQAGVELDHPSPGHMPKYPATQRSYGMIDLNTQQIDQMAGLQAELANARDREQQIMNLLHEYQEHVTRAQKYKPTSDKGEAVSPFLRLVERIWLELQAEARKQ